MLSVAALCRAEKPNVILILLDDIGTGWVSPYAQRLTTADLEPEILAAYRRVHGHQGPVDPAAHIKAAADCMPYLSKLAEGGAVFDRCFATASLCAPSRAGLLTGSFQQSWGAYWNKDVDDHGIPADRVVLAEPLQKAGYRCGMIGKWHVAKKDPAVMDRVWKEQRGEELPIPPGYKGRWPDFSKLLKGSGWQSSSFPGQHPLDRGFDYYFGYNSHDSKYFRAAELWENRARVPQRPEGEFLTDLFNDRSCEFIESAVNDEKPFFLYYAPMTLHGGIVPPPQKYSALFNTGNRYTDEYAGHLLALDAGIEQIFQTLEKYGQAENTLFFFSSDNGCTLYNVPPYNAPNRGGKGTGWMGGLNVPFVVWQPGVVKPGINREIVSLADVMPTVLEAAGASIPEGIDGKSLLPYLNGKSQNGPRESLGSANIQSSRWSYCYEANGENNKQDAEQAPLYAWYLKGDSMLMRTTAVRPGLYKALPDGYPAQTLFFDIAADPQQRKNLASDFPEQVQVYDQGIRKWLGDVEVPITSQQEDYRELLEGPLTINPPEKEESATPVSQPRVDADGDGKISFEEFSALKARQGEARGKPFKDEVLRDLFTRKDIDRDGFLSFKELAAKR
jgi:uncharacterized sulfatase